MNWDAIGALGDLIGGVAVTVTLVFLIVQLRQLSTQTRQQTLAIRHSSYSAWAANLSHFQHGTALNGELSRIFIDAGKAPAFRDDSLDEVSWLRWTLAIRAIFTIHQNLHEQHEQGLIDTAFWVYNRNWLKQLVSSTPALKGWWDTEKAAGAFIPAFVHAIEDAEANSPGEYLYRAAPSASEPAEQD